jgi:hypothetical protein
VFAIVSAVPVKKLNKCFVFHSPITFQEISTQSASQSQREIDNKFFEKEREDL